MEFVTRNTSHDCPCGGRVCRTPDIVRRHSETKRHQVWIWKMKCQELVEATTRPERIRLVTDLHEIIRPSSVSPNLPHHSPAPVSVS